MPYEKISREAMNYVQKFFTQLQPNQEQREFTLSWLYYCITGKMDKQIMKFNVGYSASNGKSTEIAVHRKVFDIYTAKLDNKVFTQGFAQRHKHIHICFTNPIRLAYMEELPPSKRMDDEYMKEWVDGREISCEIMFGTSVQRTIQAKLMAVSNNDPTFKNDSGVKRRGRQQHYNSQFVDAQYVDEANHKYLCVNDFERIFDDPIYKNAYFHTLLQNKELKIPQKAIDDFKEAVETNDNITPTIDDWFSITKNPDDFVCKNTIAYHFNCQEGTPRYKEVSAYLKQFGCTYDKGKRTSTGRGVWKGIRLLEQHELNPDQEQLPDGDATDNDTVSEI
jgi:hypothetical protein